MRFLVDAQLPAALARWLTSIGHDAQHVSEVGLASASDDQIWLAAQQFGAAIITKDQDFALRRSFARPGPAVIWIRFGNTRKTELLGRVSASLAEVIAALARRETLIELV